MLGEFGGILKVITSSLFFFYTFYNLWRMGSYLEGVMLAPSQKEAKEVKRLLGINKNKKKKRNSFQIEYSKVEPKVEKPKEEPDREKILKSLLNSTLDVEQLLSVVNTVKLIEKLLFENEDQKKLIPLVLFSLAQHQQLSPEKINKNKNKPQAKQADKNIMSQIHPSSGILEIEQTQTQTASYDEIYSNLLNSHPTDLLRASMKHLMLNHLQRIFKQQKVRISPQRGDQFGQVPNSEALNLNPQKNKIEIKFFENKQSGEMDVVEEVPESLKNNNNKNIGVTFKKLSSLGDSPSTTTKSRSKRLISVNSSTLRKNSKSSFKRLKVKSKFHPSSENGSDPKNNQDME